jgi:hypothetical protein
MPRPQKSITPLTEQKIRDLINAVEGLGTLKAACDYIGIDHGTVNHLLKVRPDLAVEMNAARERGKLVLLDTLESVAIERAKEGSDILLMFLIKKLNPEYRESYHVTTSNTPTDYVLDLSLPNDQTHNADGTTTTILDG